MKLTLVSLETDLESVRKEAATTEAVSTLKDGKSFHPNVRDASYKLQSLGVAEERVSDVIQTVVNTIAQKDIGPLPSATTQRMFGAEMLALSHQQVKEAVCGQDQMTLKYDGTTKGGTHLTELEVATKTRTYLAGTYYKADIKLQCLTKIVFMLAL